MITAKNTFLQFNFEVVGCEPSEELIKLSEMIGVGGGVNDEVVDVDDDIVDAVDHGLDQSLKTGRTSEQTHRRGDPFKLAHARQCEGCVLAGLGVQQHLPEPGREVESGENC